MPLRNAVAHIGCEVAGGLAAVFIHCQGRLFYKLIQMGAAGVAVAESALDKDLGLAQVGY